MQQQQQQRRPAPRSRAERVVYLFRILRSKERGLDRNFCPDAAKDVDALRYALRGEKEPI